MMDIRPNVLFNACVAGVAALLVGCGGRVDPNPPVYSAPIPAAAPATTANTSDRTIVQAGMAVAPGSESAVYATGKADSLDACLNFGREALYAAGTFYASKGKLTCFDSLNKPVARFLCRADSGCTPVMGFD